MEGTQWSQLVAGGLIVVNFREEGGSRSHEVALLIPPSADDGSIPRREALHNFREWSRGGVMNLRENADRVYLTTIRGGRPGRRVYDGDRLMWHLMLHGSFVMR